MKPWETAARLTAIGWYVALSMIIPILIGKWVDGRYNTGRLWTLVGFASGTFIAAYGVFEMLRSMAKKAKELNQTGKKD